MNTNNTKGALVALLQSSGVAVHSDGSIGFRDVEHVLGVAAALQAHSPPAPAVASETAAGAEPVAWWRWSYVDEQGNADADVQIGANKPTASVLPDNGFAWEPLYGTPLATPPAATKVPRLPDAVSQWVEAYRVYVEAIERYNVRLAAIRERERLYPDEFGRDSPQAEWDAWHNAERKARALIMPMYEALRSPAAHGATTRETAQAATDAAGLTPLYSTRAKAKRYDWIRENVLWANDGDESKWVFWLDGSISSDDNIREKLDAAIDSARKVTPPSAQQEGAV